MSLFRKHIFAAAADHVVYSKQPGSGDDSLILFF